jgi:hypothetical protein
MDLSQTPQETYDELKKLSEGLSTFSELVHGVPTQHDLWGLKYGLMSQVINVVMQKENGTWTEVMAAYEELVVKIHSF